MCSTTRGPALCIKITSSLTSSATCCSGTMSPARCPPWQPALITTLDPAVVQMMLGRTKYDEAEERDTELLASLVQSRIIDRWLRSDESSGDDVQDRVTHTLLRRREARR